VLLAAVVLAWFFVAAMRHKHEVELTHPFEIWWQPSVAYAGIAVVTVGVGSILAWAVGGLGVVSHTASSTAAETYGQRFDAWRAGLHALAAKPIFGWGPGQFLAATDNRFSLSETRQFGSVLFPDGHNIFIEYATTTGVVGLLCLLGWLVYAMRHRVGCLFGFALVLLASELVEPLNAGVTGMAFLALGGAALTNRRVPENTNDRESSEKRQKGRSSVRSTALPGWLSKTMPIVAIVVAVPAFIMIVGDIVLQQSYYQGHDGNVIQAASTAKTADALLFHAWPDAALQVSQAYYSLGTSGYSGALPLATQ